MVPLATAASTIIKSTNSTSSPNVVIFSTINQIATSLRKKAPNISIHEIRDDALLPLSGDFKIFEPRNIQASTFQQLKDAQILITEPVLLAKILEYNSDALPNLKWCQSTFAGVDTIFDTPGLIYPLHFTLTRFAGTFGRPIAEWCMGRIIAHERMFGLVAKDQKSRSWQGSGDALKNYRYLSDLTIVILGGCGDIGSCIARAAKFGFGMRTVAYSKNERLELPEGVDECTNDLSYALREADYLISVLPSTSETKGLLSDKAFALAGIERGGKSPVFLNCGRGDVTDEDTLLLALERGFISAAILDVFEKEPLPQTSRLWGRDDVMISPHISGVTRGQDVIEHFLRNYERYVAGDDLLFEVDWGKGY